jgi:nucleotidyltransferase substrate binding protein (TIGR01987 family)
MTEAIRWKLRFKNFTKSFEAFQRRINDYRHDPESESHQMALVQGYEIIIELAWKVMKDYLQSEGHFVPTSKQAIRQAFQSGLIQEGELWLTALDNRNLTSHTYDEAILETMVEFIAEQFEPLVTTLYSDFKEKL